MQLLALYGVVVAGAWLASTVRGETTLLRGTTVFGVHVSFLAAQAMWLLAARAAWLLAPRAAEGASLAGFAALATFAALTAASFPLRRFWLLSGFEEASFREIVELSLRQLRIPFEHEASGYALTLGRRSARVTYRSFGDRRAVLRFEARPAHSGGEPARVGEAARREPARVGEAARREPARVGEAARREAGKAAEPGDAEPRASRAAKKLDLLRSLLAKRFGRLVPRPRIRFE